jgi:putative transposase
LFGKFRHPEGQEKKARFAIYPIDDAHLMAAVRYVEQNPVAAGMVERAEQWRWSSARSHVTGRVADGDPLTDLAVLGPDVGGWQRMLAYGLEAGDSTEAATTLKARLKTGPPLADPIWIAAAEERMKRAMAPKTRTTTNDLYRVPGITLPNKRRPESKKSTMIGI